MSLSISALNLLPRAEPIANVAGGSNLALLAFPTNLNANFTNSNNRSKTIISPDSSPREPLSSSSGGDGSLSLPIKLPSTTVVTAAASISPPSTPRTDDDDKTSSHLSSVAAAATSLADALGVVAAKVAAAGRRGSSASGTSTSSSTGMRLNKFVRRLYDMLVAEQDSGIVEWRRGLLVLHSTDAFSKQILKKYFNTSSYKTFRRQLNYYGFVHVRSFSTTGTSTTALWVNRDLAKLENASISSVLTLKRVEPCDSAKTAEARRARKELAVSTVEDDLGVSPKTLQIEQIRSMALRGETVSSCGSTPVTTAATTTTTTTTTLLVSPIPLLVHCHSVAPPASMAMDTTMPTTVSSSAGASSSSVVSSSDDDEESAASAVAANLLLLLSKASNQDKPMTTSMMMTGCCYPMET